eukprot:scaffold73586_cov72-Phaeocystis_antarctica.AAC.1
MSLRTTSLHGKHARFLNHDTPNQAPRQPEQTVALLTLTLTLPLTRHLATAKASGGSRRRTAARASTRPAPRCWASSEPEICWREICCVWHGSRRISSQLV